MPKPKATADPGLDLGSAGEHAAPAPAELEKRDEEPAKPPPEAAPVLDLPGLTVVLDKFAERLAGVEARLPQREQPPSPEPVSVGRRVLRWLKEPV